MKYILLLSILFAACTKHTDSPATPTTIVNSGDKVETVSVSQANGTITINASIPQILPNRYFYRLIIFFEDGSYIYSVVIIPQDQLSTSYSFAAKKATQYVVIDQGNYFQ